MTTAWDLFISFKKKEGGKRLRRLHGSGGRSKFSARNPRLLRSPFLHPVRCLHLPAMRYALIIHFYVELGQKKLFNSKFNSNSIPPSCPLLASVCNVND